MIRSIVVPLDGSRFAEAAIPTATRLARSAHAKLHLMLVHQPAIAERAREERYLAAAVSQINAGAGSIADSSIREGVAAESLIEGIREAAADLVVMATHGHGRLAPLHANSVADGLIRTSPAPLLLVRPRPDDLPEAPGGLRSLLAPVSFDRDPELLLEGLTAFACLNQTHVTFLHVVPPATPTGPAQKRLDELADQLRARGIRAAARVVVGSDVVATIGAELARGPADLVAIASRRTEEGGWRPDDSISDQVVRTATKPVLILPAAPAPVHA